jgi:hypothetical protein
MFIADGSRQGSSPQRGDMFIAVASVNNNSSLPASTNAAICFNPSLSQGPAATCHPAGVKNHLVGLQAINMSLLCECLVVTRNASNQVFCFALLLALSTK